MVNLGKYASLMGSYGITPANFALENDFPFGEVATVIAGESWLTSFYQPKKNCIVVEFCYHTSDENENGSNNHGYFRRNH